MVHQEVRKSLIPRRMSERITEIHQTRIRLFTGDLYFSDTRFTTTMLHYFHIRFIDREILLDIVTEYWAQTRK
jgi:hypothetical protein